MLKLIPLVAVLASIAGLAHGAVVTGVGVQIKPTVGNGGFCMDANGDHKTDGTPVYVYRCNGYENQRWTVTTSEGNQHAIIGTGGFCLDVRGGGSRANGTPVQLYQCHFGPNQRFQLSPDGRIREVASGKCLIATSARERSPIVLDTCTNTPDEVFSVER